MSPRRSSLGEPLYLFGVFAAVSLGTIALQQHVRLALLWMTLALLALLHRGVQGAQARMTLASLSKGALLGLVVSVPLLAFLSAHLRTYAERLYATDDVVWLLYQACFISAPIEESFFRGVVQSGRGPLAGIGLYAIASVLFYAKLPTLAVLPLVLVVHALAGVVYAHVCGRHGLSAAVACHVVVAFVLQVLPTIIATLQLVPG